MRGKYIIAGGIFAIIGIFLLFYGGRIIILDETTIIYLIGQIIQISGGILLIVGMCFMLIGGILKDKKIKSSSPSISHTNTQNNFEKKDDGVENTIKQYEQLKKETDKKL